MGGRFACTACGKCCHGQLPLTLPDALKHADKFPLAVLWTPLRKGSKDFPLVSRLGVSVPMPKHPGLAALVVPTAYIPPQLPCPALGSDMLCKIHDDKPLRCKTMPFYPYREERFQAELLKPRKDWECDVSDTAPVVFDGQHILQRNDFDQERQEIEAEHPKIQMFANHQFKYNPMLATVLAKEATKPHPGQIVSSLSSFIVGARIGNAKEIAQRQLQVLAEFIRQTDGREDVRKYNENYRVWLEEMKYIADGQ